MNNTQITFLGTTACIFDKNDDTPSFVINDKYLFDTGFALVNNLVNNNYNPTDIEYLFFTHMHHDHYMGLPSLLFYYVQTGADIKKLKIIGPKNDVRRIVEKAMDFLQISTFWKNAGMPQIIEIEGGDTYETDDMLFQTVPSNHPVQGMCYRITDKNTGKVICATGDTAVNGALPEFFKNCDALIHEISWGYRENPYGSKLPSGHSTVSEAINLASEIKTKKLFFVHNSRDTANMAVNDAQKVERLEAINPVIGKKYIIDKGVRMRTVIVGDLQYKAQEDVTHIVDDIISLNADNVILLGDYGNCDNPDKFEEFANIANAFKKLKVKNFVPLLGNHDVQHEIMRISDIGSAEEILKNTFNVQKANAFLEFEEFSVYCMGCECPPERNTYSDYECYLSDDTINELRKRLDLNGGKPAVIITHAPPCCSGLLNKPDVHLRASNAYLNQDHNYTVFKEIIKENPQIKVWFSGHYHIGHNHVGSISKYLNTYFFLTAAPTSAARDGQHHSHILDFLDGKFSIATYDHDTHSLGEFKKINSLNPYKEYSFVGNGKVSKNYIFEAMNGHIFLMTDNGFLWEIDVENNVCLGTIHCSQSHKLDDFYVDDKYVWRICGHRKFGHELSDKKRFMREYDYERCNFIERTIKTEENGKYKIYSDSNGCFILRTGKKIKFFNDYDNRLCMMFV